MTNYNCIAWSAGYSDRCLWPHTSVGENNVLWYDSLYSNQRVLSQAGNYFTRRGPICTRFEATEENSVIDLWGKIDMNGDTIITHASIKNIFDDIPRGYDWESKLGYCDLRVFHPRTALLNIEEENGYGEIMYHYRLANNNDLDNLSNTYSMNRTIAEKNIIYETVSFSNSDSLLLQEIIGRISSSDILTFESLYYNWEEYSETQKMVGDLWKLKKIFGI